MADKLIDDIEALLKKYREQDLKILAHRDLDSMEIMSHNAKTVFAEKGTLKMVFFVGASDSNYKINVNGDPKYVSYYEGGYNYLIMTFPFTSHNLSYISGEIPYTALKGALISVGKDTKNQFGLGHFSHILLDRSCYNNSTLKLVKLYLKYRQYDDPAPIETMSESSEKPHCVACGSDCDSDCPVY